MNHFAMYQWPVRVFGFLILLGGLVAGLQAHAGQDGADTPRSLDRAELETLLSGNSLAGNGRVKDPAERYDWIAHYAADGKLRLRLKPEWGGLISDGRWWLTEDGQQCRQFETGHKKEGCWRFFREGKFLRFVPSSGTAVEGRAVALPGDAVSIE